MNNHDWHVAGFSAIRAEIRACVVPAAAALRSAPPPVPFELRPVASDTEGGGFRNRHVMQIDEALLKRVTRAENMLGDVPLVSGGNDAN